jgi:hypothetical protein
MYLYLASAPSWGASDIVKIGISGNPHKRLRSLRSSYDHLLSLIAIYAPDNSRLAEAVIKREFRPYRRSGHECFAIQVGEVTSFIEQEMGLVPCQQ